MRLSALAMRPSALALPSLTLGRCGPILLGGKQHRDTSGPTAFASPDQSCRVNRVAFSSKQAGTRATPADERAMGPLLSDPTVVDDHDEVGVYHRREPV